MALGEFGTGVHRREERLAVVPAAPRTIEDRHRLAEAVDGLTLGALHQPC